MLEILKQIDDIVWGTPLLVLLIGTGIYLTLGLGLLQVRKLHLSFKYMFDKSDDEGEGDVSSFAALCTALASTIGTGNIVGVATAIAAGGPGALFWMWVAAFFGMATKYSEGLLAVKYRNVDDNGQMSGGPMAYIENGIPAIYGEKFKTVGKVLGAMFCVFALGSAFFGIGTFAQIDSITTNVNQLFGVPVWIVTTVLLISVGAVTIGGIKSISKVAEIIVPFMAAFYIIGALMIIFTHLSQVGTAIGLVFKLAFSSSSVKGAVAGVTVKMAIQKGFARGVFSNESGLGSAPIAAAAAKTKSCVKQGLVSMSGTFIDTIIVCTMTGLIIILNGEYVKPGAAKIANTLTTSAWQTNFPIAGIGQYIVTIGLVFFAFTTIIGWNYYGERCIEHLFGVKAIIPYKIVFLLIMSLTYLNLKLNLIWTLADIVNGLMAIPNLIGLLLLSPVIFGESRKYFKELKENK